MGRGNACYGPGKRWLPEGCFWCARVAQLAVRGGASRKMEGNRGGMILKSFSGGYESWVDAYWPIGLISFGIACILWLGLFNPLQ